MDDRWPLKRKRLVTTCTECQRRKQKCDRARPCNICIARDVPEKCSYNNGFAQNAGHVTTQPNERTTNQDADEYSDTATSLQNQSTDLSSQVGYTVNHDSDAIIKTLQESMGALKTGEYFLSSHGYVLSPSLKSKYTKILTQFPAHETCVQLIEHFFSEANWYFAVLEKYYFDTMLRSWLDVKDLAIKGELENVPRELQHFPGLLFQLLAVSLQFVPLQTNLAKSLRLSCVQDVENLSEDYSTAGVEIIHILGRHKPTISAVQHDIMRSLWLKNCSRGIESWYCVCDAVRKAQELGMHRQHSILQDQDIEENLARVWYDEYKRRLWATLFSWDGHMALMLGRPRTINLKDCTVKTPLDCDIPEDPTKVVPVASTSHDPPTAYSSSLFRYSLALKVHAMLTNEINTRHVRDYEMVGELHDEVISLLKALPDAYKLDNPDRSWDIFNPHLPKRRLHIAVTTNSFLMSLHRPHINIHAASRQAAFEAALASLQSQAQFHELAGQPFHRIYTISFYTIDAGIFLCSAVEQYHPMDFQYLQRIHILSQDAISRLTVMRDKNVMARSGLQILKACYQRICSASLKNSPMQFPRRMTGENHFHAQRVTAIDSRQRNNPRGATEDSAVSTKVPELPLQNLTHHTAEVGKDPVSNTTTQQNNDIPMSPTWFNNYDGMDAHNIGGQSWTTPLDPTSWLTNLDQESFGNEDLSLDDIDVTAESWTQLDNIAELDPGESLSDSVWNSLLG